MKNKWEYMVQDLRTGWGEEDMNFNKELLNKLGDDGWELVAISSFSTAREIAYLKRKKA